MAAQMREKLLVPELSEGSPGNSGFEFTVVPESGRAELSLVKGGKAPFDGAVFAVGIAFELELSVGNGGSPLAEPVAGTDEILELVDATPLSGKGGRLEPLETVVSSLGRGGKEVWPEAAVLPLV